MQQTQNKNKQTDYDAKEEEDEGINKDIEE